MTDLTSLRERAKELECFYRIHAIVSDRARAPEEAFLRLVEVLPTGWQEPERTGARIDLFGRHYVGPGFTADGVPLARPIRVWGTPVGSITVSCLRGPNDATPAFLDEEAVLLDAIAARLGEFLEWKQTEMLERGAQRADEHWRWRQLYAEALAARVDAERFQIESIHVGGSTGSGSAGPGSDIDLYVWSRGDAGVREALAHWLAGFGECLAEVAERRTGYAFVDGVVDVHWLEGPPDQRSYPGVRPLRLGPRRR